MTESVRGRPSPRCAIARGHDRGGRRGRAGWAGRSRLLLVICGLAMAAGGHGERPGRIPAAASGVAVGPRPPLGPATPPGDLQWPLADLPRYLTSNFMEYRQGRFHAGIDLKTNSRTGYAALAAESGSISRVRTSAYGYGKAVYLTGRSGRVYVSAHLERFNDPIARLVREHQERRGRYEVDVTLTPGRLVVQKGEVLGLTGQSATAGPHLHFEVRNSRQEPLNPLACGFAVGDTIAPLIRKLRVVPVEPSSRIEGDGVGRSLSGAPGLNGRLPPLHVSGAVAFSAEITDAADVKGHRLSPYAIEVFLDGLEVYSCRNDGFRYDQSSYLTLEWLVLDGVRERWLYRRAGANGPGRGGSPWSTAPGGLTPGRHVMLLIASDFDGNSVTVTTDLIAGDGAGPAAVGSAAEPRTETNPERGDSGWEADPARISLPCGPGFTEHWLSPFLHGWTDRQGRTRAEKLDSLLAHGARGPELKNRWLAATSEDGGGPGRLWIVAPEFGDAVWTEALLWVVSDSLGVEEAETARRRQGLVWLEVAAGFWAADWPARGPVAVAFPQIVDSLAMGPQAGVYRQDGSGRWQWVAAWGEATDGAVEPGRWGLDRPGRHAIFRDTAAPYLPPADTPLLVGENESRRREGVTLPRWEMLAVPAEDGGSGLDPQSCRAVLDGRSLICEPDLPRQRFLLELPDSLGAGEHTLDFRVRDRAGLPKERTWRVVCRARSAMPVEARREPSQP
jgi:hypothetical protein